MSVLYKGTVLIWKSIVGYGGNFSYDSLATWRYLFLLFCLHVAAVQWFKDVQTTPYRLSFLFSGLTWYYVHLQILFSLCYVIFVLYTYSLCMVDMIIHSLKYVG